ncbi:2-hydroxyacid dehydrogenase [Microbacterium mitrae]|uniref:Hydroxyacid dehydrogenase n=1 Tax=Microbacterium mitrae TaxID=664640 RepID=A0A5C8HNQ6_9MICO|nr:NAD(P)-dependent oxidoreductase [Microbacterium mitrae]TXK04008.1 hydroxyacid dehydrogenase [Microbacterium mitrae]
MTSMTVSVPSARLLGDVAALLTPVEASNVELFEWTLESPSNREHIDIVVAPYMSAADRLPNLAGVATTLVQSQSIGWDDVPTSLPPGHVFANATSVHEAATAELALALTLASQRRLPLYVRQQTESKWHGRFSPSLADRRVMVLGYGGVGKAIAARLEPFEVEIVPVASSARNEDGVHVHGIDELPELLPTTEILITSLPANDATHHIIDDAVLSALPDGALVVNVGRGTLIDPVALAEHTAGGRLRAALDVTEPEPLPVDSPLWTIDNVLITPHVGGAASSMQPRIARLIVRQIRHLLAGETPENIVFTS